MVYESINFYFRGDVDKTLDILTENDSPLKILEKGKDITLILKDQKDFRLTYSGRGVFLISQDDDHQKAQERIKFRITSLLSYRGVENQQNFDNLRKILEYLMKKELPFYAMAVKDNLDCVLVSGFNPEEGIVISEAVEEPLNRLSLR